MNKSVSVFRWVAAFLLAFVVSVFPLLQVTADASGPMTWQVDVGAQSHDQAIQVNYFFPRAITVHEGDSINWTWRTGEIHTVSFLNGNAPAFDPTFPFGGNVIPVPTPLPPGNPFGQVSSGILAKAPPPAPVPTFKVTFTTAGTFNYQCLIHSTMSGVVHVVKADQPLPKTQKQYNRESAPAKARLLGEGARLRGQGMAAARRAGRDQVTAGIGAVHDTGSIAILRFLPQKINIKVGDTVTWTNRDPETPHSVTFNPISDDPFAAQTPYGLSTPMATLPGMAIMSDTHQQVNRGRLTNGSLPELPQNLMRGPVFKVKFTKAGTYNYECVLHDELGMKGIVNVTN